MRMQISMAIHARCPRLAQNALDLAAAAQDMLHAALHGSVSVLHGFRSAKYRREQLRGERPLTIEDISELVLENATALIPFVDLLARAVGGRFVRESVIPLSSVHEAIARHSTECCEFQVATVRAIEDGRIDEAELARIETEGREAILTIERTLASARQSCAAGRK